MSEEIDIKVVLAMGWKPRTVSEQPFGDGTFVLYDGPGGECMQPGVSWKFSESIAAARTMEDWIEAEHPGLCDDYAIALYAVTSRVWQAGACKGWAMAHATPEQRCRAFLAAMGK